MREQDFLEVQSLLLLSHLATVSFLLGPHLSQALIPTAKWAIYIPLSDLSYIKFKMSSVAMWAILTKLGGKRAVFKTWLLYRGFIDSAV